MVSAVKKDFNENKNLYFRLNNFIEKNTKTLHIADDYGQLDMLLSLQQASRSVFSFIKNEEKKSVASNNYLVNRRKINYISDVSSLQNDFDILLISTPNFDWKNINFIPKKIIIIKNIDIKIPENFEKISGENGIKVYFNNLP